MRSEFDQYVHYDEQCGDWVVCTWNQSAAQYQGSMTVQARRVTGMSGQYGRRLGQLDQCYRYKNRRHALARARAIYGDMI